MRRIVILSYTERGGQLNREIAACLRGGGDVAVSRIWGADFSSTDCLLEEEWRRTAAFVFVGAAGIAVRHIAPFLTDKFHDPAVLVADEDGRFVIPILSGHVGGGVRLARDVADGIGAQAVVTTATDVRGRFAVDVFAVRNHLCVPDAAAIRAVSAAVLRGDTVRLRTGIPIAGEPPAGVEALPAGAERPAGLSDRTDAALIVEAADGGELCRLAHRSYVVGVGCKKGKDGGALYDFLREVCALSGIGEERICAVASVDRKREEPGVWELARRLRASYEVFSAGELAQIGDRVHASAFVERTLGVDNVCERSALCLAKCLAAGGGYRLIAEKQARDGMTLAVAAFSPSSYHWAE